jgi:phage terminase small subunit|tara:strand:+ start:370 stop:750 length:381 start_codon:yes stop_codon:yes gene_type:complete
MDKKELTLKQKGFLDHLIETGGDPKKAAELAGYAPNTHWQVTKALKTEIIDLASNILAQSAPKAAIKLVDIMDSDKPIPQANMRLQAAQTILDRIGLGKADRLDVSHEVKGGIFILPAKEELIIEA